jgi:hypothetical protein
MELTVVRDNMTLSVGGDQNSLNRMMQTIAISVSRQRRDFKQNIEMATECPKFAAHHWHSDARFNHRCCIQWSLFRNSFASIEEELLDNDDHLL